MAPNRLCLITAQAPVPAFLGGSCPLGCSLSAPATGGCSVFSLQCSMYAAGSEKEKRAGCPLHGGTIAHLFVFCKGGVAGARTPASARRWGRMGLSWPAPSFGEGSGLACALLRRRVWLGLRRCPTCPPSNVFGNRGTRCTPGGGLPSHAPCLVERRRQRFLAWRVGTRFLTCPEESGQRQRVPPVGRREGACSGGRRWPPAEWLGHRTAIAESKEAPGRFPGASLETRR